MNKEWYTSVFRGFQEANRSLHVDFLSQFRIFGAEGVANHRGEVDNAVVPCFTEEFL